MSRIKPLYDGIKFCAVITSDNHIDIKAKDNKKRLKTLKNVIEDCEQSEVFPDALITVGDNVSRGLAENWELYKKCFDGKKPAENIILTLGNHDSWSKDGYEGYFDGIKNFYKYRKEICGISEEKPYFTKVLGGFCFIFLGTDIVPENEDCAGFSVKQTGWFKSEIEKAAKTEKPIFVFCHQSVNGNHGLPKTWEAKEREWEPEIGGIGSSSGKIKEILGQYKNVYFFSGHSHMALCGEYSMNVRGYASFEKHGNVNFVNLPCLTRWNHHALGKEKTGQCVGQGVILEIYDGKVVIRPRNFNKSKMNKKIKIKDGKPFFEEIY